MQTISYFNLSRYRSELMGISILMIMLFHTIGGLGVIGLWGRPFRPCIAFDIGVEFFLMLSAIGCFYSLRNNTNTVAFYKRRFIRLVPTCWIIILLHSFLIEYLLSHNISLAECLLDFGFISIFIGRMEFWFITHILICYLFTPLLFRITANRSYLICVVILSVLLYLLAVEIDNKGLLYLNLIVCRLPVYLFGLYVANKVLNNNFSRINRLLIFIFVIVCYFGVSMYLSGWKKYLAMGIISLPSLLLLSSWLDSLGNKRLNKFFAFFGSISLELYLIHVNFGLRIADALIPNAIIMRILISISCSVIIALVIRYFVSYLMIMCSRDVAQVQNK